MLAQAYGGRVSAYYPSFSDAPLARVHYIIGVDARRRISSPTSTRWRRAIAEAARSWESKLEAAAARDAGDADRGRRADGPLCGRLPAGLSRPLRRREAVPDIVDHGGRRRRRIRSPSAPIARPAIRPSQLPLQALPLAGAGAAGRRAADPRQHGPEGAGRGRLPGPAATAIRPTRSGRTSSPWPTPTARRRASTRSTAAFEQAFLAVWNGGPRTTASTGWWSSWASPGARRR